MEGPRQFRLRPPPLSLGPERPHGPSSGRLEGMAGVAQMALSTRGPPLWPGMAHSIRTCRRTLSITEANI